MSLYDLEVRDVAPIVQLQLDDLEALKQGHKGKFREGEQSDEEIAIELYRKELLGHAMVAFDKAMSRSIARAVSLDADVIEAHRREEEQANMDRQMAINLNSRGVFRPPSKPSQEKKDDLDDGLLSKLAALYVGHADDVDEPCEAESSSWAASRASMEAMLSEIRERPRECISCGEKFNSTAGSRCPCSHEYCRACLRNLFEASLSDESLFPPRCCGQPIPAKEIRYFLSSELVEKYETRKIELATPNRTYCHAPTCSAFIPPQQIRGDVAKCAHCRTKTCAICKGSAHDGDCPQDSAIQELLRVAAENGWQRCFKCGRVVELDHGCNHMTCPCGAQFCYVCGQQWTNPKSCACPQWNEERLYSRAHVIVNRDPNAQFLDDHRRAALLERARRNLVEHHECTHPSWASRSGSHRCEQCRDVLPIFIYECRRCRILACRRCRYNRM